MNSPWYNLFKRSKKTSKSASKPTKEVIMTIPQYKHLPSGYLKDILGGEYNYLTAVAFVGTYDSRAYWLFICRCGGFTVRREPEPRETGKVSCGCERIKNARIAAVKALTTHGATGSPTYVAWQAMKNRCIPTHFQSHLYHDRGIKVCEAWEKSYETFLADMGKKPTPKHSLDRIDNDKGYSPENCRWATSSEQAKNRRVTKFVEYKGAQVTLTELSKIVGVSYKTLWYRAKNNRPLDVGLWEESKRWQ